MRAITACDPRAWTAAIVGRPESWYFRLPTECVHLVVNKVQAQHFEGQLLTQLRLSPAERTACVRALIPVLQELERGRGFVILHGLPLEEHNSTKLTACYWLIGQALGEPVEQNVEACSLRCPRQRLENCYFKEIKRVFMNEKMAFS